jgi:hypothetical protein
MSAEEVLTDLGKLRVADHARLMADNQRLLDAARKNEDWQRDLTRRVAEFQAGQLCGNDLPPAESATEEPVNIYVDSPITIHPQAAAPAALPAPASPSPPRPTAAPIAPAPSLAAKLAPYALIAASTLGAGGLGAAAATYLLRPASTPVPSASPTATTPGSPVYDVQKWNPPASP